jgi:hypothetical protein
MFDLMYGPLLIVYILLLVILPSQELKDTWKEADRKRNQLYSMFYWGS